MFKVRVELRPEGGWNRIPKEQQYDISKKDELPYPPQIGIIYVFELSNKDLTEGSIAEVIYYSHDKSTTIVVEVPVHMWKYDEFVKAGWQND